MRVWWQVHHGGFSAAPNASNPTGPNLAACVCRLVSNGHRFVANTPGGYDDDGRCALRRQNSVDVLCFWV